MPTDPRRHRRCTRLACLLAAVSALPAGAARGQPVTSTLFDDSLAAAEAEDPSELTPPMLDESIAASEQDAVSQPPKSSWHDYQGQYATVHAGLAVMFEGAGFKQSGEGKQQVGELLPAYKWRDARLTLSGTFPKLKNVTWKTAVMYDGPSDDWFVRETGLIIAVPKLWGHLFVGRTKEGFSLAKHMIGYAVWGLERQPMNDATIPIMADGIRWMGYAPRRHLVWNLGFFNEKYSQSRHNPYYDRQAVARVAWLPFFSEEKGSLLHLGVSLRYAEPQDGQLRARSRPEAFPAPYFVDTGTFDADHTRMIAPEIYYERRSWIVGSEYFVEASSTPDNSDPLFHGGEVFVSWLATGETRKYSTKGGIFGFVSPKSSVFKGGRGAVEPILKLTYIDLNDGPIQGGKMWRLSPMLAWHLSDAWRWTFAYGYGVLDRYDKKGATQFFQSRIQLQF
jgi:phosphate-selective porin OprO and OprP